MALLLELRKDPHRILVRPFGKLHNVVAIRSNRLAARRVDDDRAVHPGLFLESGMGVIPIGAALSHREAVHERLAGRDTAIADPRHAIHLERQAQTVPGYGRY